MVSVNGSTRGCWDVLAWRDGDVVFVESNRRGKDRLNQNQYGWVDAGLRAGLPLTAFVIVEWDIGA